MYIDNLFLSMYIQLELTCCLPLCIVEAHKYIDNLSLCTVGTTATADPGPEEGQSEREGGDRGGLQ